MRNDPHPRSRIGAKRLIPYLVNMSRQYKYYDLIMAAFVTVLLTNYVLKVLWEVFSTPVTYKVVAFLKKKENEDYYDRDTDFTPFSLK